MITDNSEQILMDLVSKNYVVYAPKSIKPIKRDYKELDDYEEFKALTSPELVFVWWFACQVSPIIDLPEEKRVMVAVDKAFKIKSQAEARSWSTRTWTFPVTSRPPSSAWIASIRVDVSAPFTTTCICSSSARA